MIFKPCAKIAQVKEILAKELKTLYGTIRTFNNYRQKEDARAQKEDARQVPTSFPSSGISIRAEGSHNQTSTCGRQGRVIDDAITQDSFNEAIPEHFKFMKNNHVHDEDTEIEPLRKILVRAKITDPVFALWEH